MLAYFTLQFFRVAEMTYFHMSLLCFRERQTMNCPYCGEWLVLMTSWSLRKVHQRFRISKNSLLEVWNSSVVSWSNHPSSFYSHPPRRKWRTYRLLMYSRVV